MSKERSRGEVDGVIWSELLGTMVVNGGGSDVVSSHRELFFGYGWISLINVGCEGP